jgi:hypothetical protein
VVGVTVAVVGGDVGADGVLVVVVGAPGELVVAVAVVVVVPVLVPLPVVVGVADGEVVDVVVRPEPELVAGGPSTFVESRPTAESLLNSDSRHSPTPSGNGPSAAATDWARTCRPSLVGCNRSPLKMPGALEIVRQSSTVTPLRSAASR